MYKPAGILKKFGTESNGISGVVAFALAALCASVGPVEAIRAATRTIVKRRIDFLL
jgi:hypothetical protein